MHDYFEKNSGPLLAYDKFAFEKLKRYFRFWKYLVHIKIINDVNKVINFEGTIVFKWVVYDKMQECTCGLCASLKAFGILRLYRVKDVDALPKGTRHWPARLVFLASTFSSQAFGANHKHNLNRRRIHFDDRASPILDEPNDCDICYSSPIRSNCYVKTRGCGHIFCSTCLLRWAEDAEKSFQWPPSCLGCRQAIQPPNGNHMFFKRDSHSRTRVRMSYRWYDNVNVTHHYYGLEKA